MKKQKFSLYVFFYIIIILFVCDQTSKYFARLFLADGQAIQFIPNFLDLIYVANKGIAWSIFATAPSYIQIPLLLILPSLFTIVILTYTIRFWDNLVSSQKLGWALILAGATGNLFDRFVFQAVTDFMHFRFFTTSFFVNNLADDFISIGVLLVLWKDISRFNFSYKRR